MRDVSQSSCFDVVVVGGGLSGLCTARCLHDAGVRVVLLEARDRVGGRTWSPNLAGSQIDLGAQWVGPGQDRVLRLIAELGLQTHAQHRAGKNLLLNGDELRRFRRILPPLKQLDNLEVAYHFVLLEILSRFSGEPGGGAETRFQRHLDRGSLENYLANRVRSQDVRALLRAAFEMIIASDMHQVSFLHFMRYLRAGGGFRRVAEVDNGAQDLRVVGGTQQLSIRIADRLERVVHLEEPVKSIDYRADSVELQTTYGRYRAQRAVLALPPTLISRIAFTPELPSKRKQLNARMQMGSVLKTVVGYDEPFWRDQGLSGEALITTGPIRGVFDNCNKTNGMASLAVFSIGAEAKKLGALPEHERKQVIADGLVRLFGERARSIVAHADKDWNADRHSDGCYAAVAPPRMITACGDAVRRPIGPLFFAGAETATKWCGFLDGAIEAGERAAEEAMASLERRRPAATRESRERVHETETVANRDHRVSFRRRCT